MLGVGTGGLAYLMYMSHKMQMDHMKSRANNQMHLFNPIVQQRIRQSLGYFGGGLAATAMLTALLRNNMFALNHPWMLMFGSLGLLIATRMTNYQ